MRDYRKTVGARINKKGMKAVPEVELAAAEIARLPPLVFAGECRTLQARLAKCASGEAFLLQGEREREQNTEERRMASRRRP